MGSINKDLTLPLDPAKIIRLDDNTTRLDENVYNMDTFRRLITGITNILPYYTTKLTEYYYLFDLNTKYDEEKENYNTNTQKEFTDILGRSRNRFITFLLLLVIRGLHINCNYMCSFIFYFSVRLVPNEKNRDCGIIDTTSICVFKYYDGYYSSVTWCL